MLGQNKLKKPVEVIGRHGTIECFWEGGVVKQFISNNTDNKAGELTDAADGACYFTAPTANLFGLQAGGRSCRNDRSSILYKCYKRYPW